MMLLITRVTAGSWLKTIVDNSGPNSSAGKMAAEFLALQ